jgi:hypothetical protein
MTVSEASVGKDVVDLTEGEVETDNKEAEVDENQQDGFVASGTDGSES